MMAIGDWSAAELCQDSDLESFESNVLEWARGEGSARKWRVQAKSLIEHELRQHFARTDQLVNASVTAGDSRVDVLDLIPDLTPLKFAACYLTLHLLCNDCNAGTGDFWDRKGEMYWHKYKEELPSGLSLLSVDIDESEAIAESERYYLNKGVTFSR